jgi:hypothetical protein
MNSVRLEMSTTSENNGGESLKMKSIRSLYSGM